jgi:hypothetical protein
MRPLLVGAANERVKPALLLEHVARSRLGGFGLEGEVHAFMPPVLLRMPGVMRSS